MSKKDIATSSSMNYFLVVPSGSEIDRPYPRGFYMGSDGDLDITGEDGIRVTFKGLTVGTWVPVGAKIVHAAPTDTVGLR